MVFYLSKLNNSGSISWLEREELNENDWTRFIHVVVGKRFINHLSVKTSKENLSYKELNLRKSELNSEEKSKSW